MSHRLFVAITPPEPVVDALVDTMEALDNARWQSDEQLHLTLRFVGEVDRHMAEDLANTLAQIDFAPFEIRVDGVGHFETRGRVRAIWAKVERSPALLDLQQRVEQACRRAGLAPETRVFTPHVTVARLNRSSARGDIAAWLARNADLRLPPWQVDHFVLYESHLAKNGSIYAPTVKYPASGA